MHFVNRSDCPERLTDHQAAWTQPWIDHYRWSKESGMAQPNKPGDGHWRDDDIRLPLIKDFHNNCGYCGVALPTQPIDEGNEAGDNQQASKGDVDHFRPKAINPELVYQWCNYIWSCKPCNQRKGKFDSDTYPMLNPCCRSDCAPLVYIEDSGQYRLADRVKSNNDWQKRLAHNSGKTFLNAPETCKERQLKTSTLRLRFDSIAKNLEMISKLQPEQQMLTNTLQRQINDSMAEIGTILGSPAFYLLLQQQYQLLLAEYPQVAKLLPTAENKEFKQE